MQDPVQSSPLIAFKKIEQTRPDHTRQEEQLEEEYVEQLEEQSEEQLEEQLEKRLEEQSEDQLDEQLIGRCQGWCNITKALNGYPKIDLIR